MRTRQSNHNNAHNNLNLKEVARVRSQTYQKQMGRGRPSGQRFKYDTQPQAPNNGENQVRRQLNRYGRTDSSRTSILWRLQTSEWYLYKMRKTKQSLHQNDQIAKENWKQLTVFSGGANRFSITAPLYKNARISQAEQHSTQHKDVMGPRDCASHATHR